MTSSSISYAFWGSDEFSLTVLQELIKAGYSPALIVSVPDQPKGRKKVITPTLLKTFAIDHNIPCITPEDLSHGAFISEYTNYNLDVAIVASYGKIIPKNILEIPKSKTLNVHPSLLPKWRGSSPIQNTIIHDDMAGVSIMKLDNKMDHGPIVAQQEVTLPDVHSNPPLYENLRDELATRGGKILAELLLQWIAGEITSEPQDHPSATFSKMLQKSDGEILLSDNPSINLRKIRALNPWPGTFFIHQKEGRRIRVKVLSAHISDEKLVIEKVIPEGKSEMDWESFERGYL